MKNMKKLLSLALALAMVFSLSVTAWADDESGDNNNTETPSQTNTNSTEVANGTGSTNVKVDIKAAQLSVTVPTELVVDVGADGTITCSTSAKVKNNSIAPIAVTQVEIKSQSVGSGNDAKEWELIQYKDNSKKIDGTMTADSTKIGISIKVGDNQALTTTGGNNKTKTETFTTNYSIAANTEANVTYDAVTSAFSKDLNATPVQVTFTVGWASGNNT